MADTRSFDQRDAPAGAAPVSSARGPSGHDKNADVPPSHKPDNEEPVMTLEADLPSDGRDEVGEAMIRNLLQRPPKSEPPVLG
ncbi:hypothetical protein [Polaromonas sp.]|uniref:hypothetical protein n=1 Tax=Polaromonas sp. TaxID=1869339 RepID=UPI0017A0ACF9|nr:hypothetical protein [Polaromonas sp.]NMM06171.1 hypothetical protein [Polaromonas sp.]